MTTHRPTKNRSKQNFSHDPSVSCMYCLGERATVNFSGPRGKKMFPKNRRYFPALGCDGLLVVIDNVFGPLPQMKKTRKAKR